LSLGLLQNEEVSLNHDKALVTWNSSEYSGGNNEFESWRKSDNQPCRLTLQKMNTTSREGIKLGDIKYIMPVLIALFL
jgi:hypothetical protein